MKIAGEYRIEADRETVWRAINDPEILRHCIPGCEEIVQETSTDWTAKVVAKVGPVKARFAGKIRLEDLDPPAACRIVGEGTGGAAGFAKGGANVTLEADGGATILRYDADTEIGGKLAQIGGRLIEGFAKKYANDFFSKFSEVVAHQPADGSSQAAGVPSGSGAPDSGPLPTETGAVASSGAQPLDPAPHLGLDPAGASAGLALADTKEAGSHAAPMHPSARPLATSSPASHSMQAPMHGAGLSPGQGHRGGWFDAQVFTIIVLASLLIFMTVMFALRT